MLVRIGTFVNMKTFVLVLALAAACLAHHGVPEEHIDHSKVIPRERVFDPIEGAPVPKPARIINGNAASRGQFPYQAALYLDGSSFCGGSLISNQWVLTAAHCASGTTTFTIYLGATQLNVVEDSRLVITTRTKIVHSGYFSLLLNNDIAVVNLGQTVPINANIAPVSLASGSDTYAGSTARVSGWGKTSDVGGVSNTLNYVDLSIITNSVCQNTYSSLIVVSSTICAQGTGGRSTCNGDSGGPLVDVNSGRQIGIVSFGPSAGCTQGYAVGFARVTSFAAWITSNTGVSV